MFSKIKNLKIWESIPKWNTPVSGKSLTLKEWLMYIVGGSGAMGAAVFLSYLTLTHGVYIASALSINVDHITIIAVVTSIVAIVTTPMISMLIDNTNTRFGKFRPYLIAMPIPIVICFVALGQIANISNYTVMIVLYTIVFNIANTLNRIYTIAFTSLVYVLSPSTEERTQLMSIGTFFTSLGPTIVGFLYPTLSNILFKKGNIAGIDTLPSAQILVPILGGIFFALGLVMAFSIKERTIVNKEFKQKQKFTQGVKKTFENKYFWIQNTSGLLGIIKGFVSATFVIWYINYIIRPELIASGANQVADIMQSIVFTLMGNASVPGMLLAPYFIKKFGKKNIILFTNIGMMVSLLPIVFIHNAWVGLAMIYVFTLFSGFQIVTTPACQAEINDYQQFKTGDRIEGFLTQFGSMFSTIVGIGTAFIAPAVYKSFGYIDDTSVLFNNETVYSIVGTMAIFSAISALLCAIPFFFWDMTENKHKQIMEVLKVRSIHSFNIIDTVVKDKLESDLLGGDIDALNKYLQETDQTDVVDKMNA